ncbi:unnamed protein product [Brassica oleracea var. botrytis]
MGLVVVAVKPLERLEVECTFSHCVLGHHRFGICQVGAMVVAMLSNIRRDRSLSQHIVCCSKELRLMVQKTLMEFCYGGREISAFNLIHYCLVVI